ncbi:MAG: hypothetical protein NUK65_12985 [Firmicutes bacterium]|nr:hypothetical protein [Bacillota bacterium]
MDNVDIFQESVHNGVISVDNPVDTVDYYVKLTTTFLTKSFKNSEMTVNRYLT